MLPRDRLHRQAKGFDAAGPLARSHRQRPRTQPLQARNPPQARGELEGVGAGAAEGLAGGAGGLGHGGLVVDAAGPQGREGHRGLYQRPQPLPLGVRSPADLV